MPQGTFEGLSDRESEVLSLAADGATDKDIARILNISTATVGTYWSRMRAKLGVNGRTAIVAKALRARLDQESAAAKEEANRHRQIAIRAKRTEQKCLERAMQALADIECAPVPLIGLDVFGRIEFWNHAASRALGYMADEVLGKPFPGNPSCVAKSLTAIRNPGTMPQGPFRERERLRTKNGKIRDAILYLAARRLAPARCTGLIVAIHLVDATPSAVAHVTDPTPHVEKT